MDLKRKLIKTIKIEPSNLKYCADNNVINGTLLLEIERIMQIHTDKQLILHGVSKSVAKKYAEFCVRCDREKLPLLELDDYIKQYCC